MAVIRGVKAVRTLLNNLPAHLQAEATKPVRAATKQMHRRVMELLNSAAAWAPLYHGLPGMQNVDTKGHPAGTARRSYRYSVTKNGMVGRVGQLSPAAASDGFHLRMFFTGTVHQPARPIHYDVFDQESPIFIGEQKKALTKALMVLK